MPYRNVWLTLTSLSIAAGTTCLIGCGSSNPPQQQRTAAPETQSATMYSAPATVAPTPPPPPAAAPEPPTGMSDQPQAPQPTAAPMGDEQVVAIVIAANNGELEQAKLVATHSKNPKVKAFAEKMIKDHAQILKDTHGLVQRVHIVIIENPTSQKLEQDSRQLMDALRSKHAVDFDKEYVGAQIREHRELLDALDNKLIPNAKNPELKNQLMQTRNKVEMHLREAEDIARLIIVGIQ